LHIFNLATSSVPCEAKTQKYITGWPRFVASSRKGSCGKRQPDLKVCGFIRPRGQILRARHHEDTVY
jgi:hypothetical protein